MEGIEDSNHDSPTESDGQRRYMEFSGVSSHPLSVRTLKSTGPRAEWTWEKDSFTVHLSSNSSSWYQLEPS